MAVPYMPLFIADYMADTAHLTTIEHGAYMLLIMTYWQRGKELPDDDRKLARIAGLGPREWGRVRDTLSDFFEINRGGWFHSRIETELRLMRDKSLKKRKAGLARAKQMHSRCSANAQLTDTDTDTDKEKIESPDGDSTEKPPGGGFVVGGKKIDDPPTGGGEDKPPKPPKAAPVPAEQIECAREAWQKMAKATGLPLVKTLTGKRLEGLKARIRQFGIDDVVAAIEKVGDDPWCHGRNPTGWFANFDHITREKSINRLIEGGNHSGESARNYSSGRSVRPNTLAASADRKLGLSRESGRAGFDPD